LFTYWLVGECAFYLGTSDSELPLCRPDSLRLNAYDADAELPKVCRTRTFDNIASEQLSEELSAFRPSRSLQRTPPPNVTVANSAGRTFSLEQGLDSHCSSTCQDHSNEQKPGFSQLRCSSSSSLAVDLEKPKMLERQKGAVTSMRGFAQGNGRLPLSSRKSMTAISSTHSEPTSTTGDLSGASSVCLGRSQGVPSSRVVLNKKKKQTVATVTPMSSPSSKQVMTTQATRKLVHEVSPLVRNQARRVGDLSPVRHLTSEFGRLGGSLETTSGVSPPMRIPCSGDFSTSSVMDNSASSFELDILKLVDKGGISITPVLGYRQKTLEMITKLAASRGLKFGLQEVVRQNDDSILVDVLNVLNRKP
ncbi:hypothetical protein D918_02157, partial [Trichuris suis]